MTPPTELACPICNGAIDLTEAEDGLSFPCPHCEEVLCFYAEDDEGQEARLLAEGAAPPPVPPSASQRRHARRAAVSRAKSMRVASLWVLIAAGLFAVVGTVMGFQARNDAAAGLSLLEFSADDEVYELADGSERTAKELRDQLKSEVRLVFVLNYALALIMLGCWWWSRRAALPALMTALGVYALVLLVNTVADPSTLVHGIVLKVLIVLALGGGVRAAWQERAAAAAA